MSAISRARIIALIPAGALALPVGGCGGARAGAPARAATASHAAADTRPSSPPPLRAGTSRMLPAAVQLPAVTPGAGGVLAMAGLDASDSSVSDITLIDGAGARSVGQLPQALHDAAAASIDGQAYLFGGGDAGSTSDAIYRVAASGASAVGRLPVAASDVAAATVGQTAYIVGGYTVSAPLRTIVAFTPGAGARIVGMLPRPLRYASVAAVRGHVLVAGGTSGVTAERAILSFDPATGRVRRVGELPYPVTHAAGAALGGWLYLLGGRSESLSGQRSAILAIDPVSGAVHPAGHLPQALSDLGAASLPNRIVIVGGRDSAGAVHDRALTLLPGAR